MTDKKQITLAIPEDMLQLLDEFRYAQDIVPSRTQAFFFLFQKGLVAWEEKK